MKKNIFAVCDLEVDYAHNFMEYLNQKRSIPFEIQAFTSVEKLASFTRKNKIAILLISDKAMCPQVKELDIDKVMILSEGVHDPRLDQYPSVYKYQSSAKVLREVMACYGTETKEEEESLAEKRPMEIYGIYSPVNRALKTTFALTLGQVLAKNKVVLYLNLESYAGFEGLFETAYEFNLSDLLYYVRQENTNLIHKLSTVVCSIENLDYVPPVLSPVDLHETTQEEWERLLREMALHSNYEVLLLDIGESACQTYQLLEKCKKIYMPVLTDWISQAKVEQFEKLMRIWDMKEILGKIEKLKLPYYTSKERGVEYVKQLMWSELGDYTKELVRREMG